MPSNADALTWHDCESLAARRHALHSSQISHRPLSNDYELVGLVAEAAVARRLGLDMDLSDHPEGDGRVDFYTHIGTIDAKGAQKPKHLLREVGKPHSDILVLVKVSIVQKMYRIIGWEYDSEMLECATGNMPGYTVNNHIKPAGDLRSISELDKLIQGKVGVKT